MTTSVFKIEGRARGPEYVAEAVACYDQALHAITDGSYGDEKIAAWDERLSRIFNRGFWDGYYTVKFMQAEVAFARYGHAEGTVTKHFDFYRFSCRSGCTTTIFLPPDR